METSLDRSIRHWWVILLRGILFIAVGIYMVCSPQTAFETLGFLFGLTIFITGLAELVRATNDSTSTNRGWHIFLGIVDLIIGGVLMGHIAASVAILRLMVGLWFLFRGIWLFGFAGIMRHAWVTTLGGFLCIIFAGLIIFNVSFGSMTLILITALAFILAGLFNIILGLGVRKKMP